MNIKLHKILPKNNNKRGLVCLGIYIVTGLALHILSAWYSSSVGACTGYGLIGALLLNALLFPFLWIFTSVYIYLNQNVKDRGERLIVAIPSGFGIAVAVTFFFHILILSKIIFALFTIHGCSM